MQISILIVVILGASFYWFQFRPTQIRKNCWNRIENIKTGEIKNSKFNKEGVLAQFGVSDAVDILYKDCLREKGLDN